jgi:hypothetical protein
VAKRLKWRTTEIRALTHRGEYFLQARNGWAYAYLSDFAGGITMLPEHGDRSAIERACAEHAARQPSYPFLLGWPADGEVSP